MNIDLLKFGTTLSSRDDGREAFKSIQSLLEEIKDDEKIIINFKGVNTFSPSWGDEFITKIAQRYKDRLILINTQNASVKATLEILSEISDIKFVIE